MARLVVGSIGTFDGEVINGDDEVIGRTRLFYRVDECRTDDHGATLILAMTPLRILFMPLEPLEPEV